MSIDDIHELGLHIASPEFVSSQINLGDREVGGEAFSNVLEAVIAEVVVGEVECFQAAEIVGEIVAELHGGGVGEEIS